jgi:GGDEF domain-containing protein
VALGSALGAAAVALVVGEGSAAAALLVAGGSIVGAGAGAGLAFIRPAWRALLAARHGARRDRDASPSGDSTLASAWPMPDAATAAAPSSRAAWAASRRAPAAAAPRPRTPREAAWPPAEAARRAREAACWPAAVSEEHRLLAQARREIARARRHGHGMAIAVLAVDGVVPAGADSAGGSAVHASVVARVAATLRAGDAAAASATPGRLLVLLSPADATGALDAAERLRSGVESGQFWPPGRAPRPGAASAGVALLAPRHVDAEGVLADATVALEAALAAGGHCVRAAPATSGAADGLRRGG